ncbi:c-type cytochrome [Candidatus Poribacteria bacterium]|nr:c-type cytochrome [Candidatus Poribacteria bacterium]MYK24646.1 c-type cytochrome [Candidatus Poribacteria bacterium]
MSRNTLIKIASLILMVVSFIAYIAGASAFPIASENLLPWSVWFLVAVIINIVLWSSVMRLLTFSLAVIWFYAFVAGLVPESSTAVNLTELDWSDPDAVAEQGALVFNGKGQCAACHTVDTTAPPGRCPDLTDIGTNAATRVPGMDAKAYLIESMYQPANFLVPGYGKIMPEVWKAPIALSKLEIEAVIAYLQSQGGEIDPTPFDEPIDRADAGTTAEALPPLLTGDPELGKKVFVDAACITCHAVTGIESPAAGETTNEDFEIVTAPDLSEIAAFNDMRYLEESILVPGAQIVSGYGAVTVRAKGTTFQGTLVSQDEEKIVVRTKTADGVEEEHTILLSEFDDEPIEELTDLEAKGYFTLTLTPVDADAPVSGQLVSETDETVTLKIGEENQTFSKTDVKMQMTLVNYDDEVTVGEHVSGTMDDFEIVLIVDGTEEIYDPFDYNSGTLTRASGKRLHVTSPMPENFPILLSVADLTNLLSFLSTLTGATAEAGTEEATEAPAE